jgi:primary-amine oxidase
MTRLEAGAHPLAMTTEAEVHTVRDVLAEAGLLTDTVRYTFFAPEEPTKDEVLSGGAADRCFRVVLLDLASGASWDTVVSTDYPMPEGSSAMVRPTSGSSWT